MDNSDDAKVGDVLSLRYCLVSDDQYTELRSTCSDSCSASDEPYFHSSSGDNFGWCLCSEFYDAYSRNVKGSKFKKVV